MASIKPHQNSSMEQAVSGHKNDVRNTDNKSLDNEQQTRRQRSSSVISEASVSILQRMFQPEYSVIRKMLWCLIVLACSSICFWQLCLRIQDYLQEPTSFQFTVERFHEFHFPAITVCPAREPFNDDAWHEAFKLPNFLDSPKSNASLDEIWNEYAVKVSDMVFIASCNESNHCDFLYGMNTTLKATILPTFWGLCVSLSRDSPIEYRGASTFLNIYLSAGPYGREWFGKDVAAQYFFHAPDVTHRHDAFLLAELWSRNRDTTVQVTIKEFHFLNSTRKPCDSQEAVITCKNKCIDDMLDNVVNCSLPFMTSKWPACKTAADAKISFDQTREFYYTFNSSKCVCRRQCDEKLYTANTNTAEKRHDNVTAMIVMFADNLVEKIYEEKAYSFSALVSDVGGSLGIFLGVSILSLLKLFEDVVRGIKKKK